MKHKRPRPVRRVVDPGLQALRTDRNRADARHDAAEDGRKRIVQPPALDLDASLRREALRLAAELAEDVPDGLSDHQVRASGEPVDEVLGQFGDRLELRRLLLLLE